MARVLAVTGRVLAPTKIVMDYEVKMKPTFLNLEPHLSIGRRPFNQCFGSGSALKLTPWIRICIRDADSGFRSYKLTQKNSKYVFFTSLLTYFHRL